MVGRIQEQSLQSVGRNWERREFLRVEVPRSVRFLRAAALPDEVLDAKLVDVSMGGIQLQLDAPLVMGEPIVVEITEPSRHICSLPATVVRIAEFPADQHRVGCELKVELTRRQFETLRSLVPTAQV